MTESPYAIPEEDLVANARVPVEEQVVDHPDRRLGGGGGSDAALPYGDGLDADGE